MDADRSIQDSLKVETFDPFEEFLLRLKNESNALMTIRKRK